MTLRPEELGVLAARSTREAATIADALRESGADVMELDGSNVTDKLTLMRRFADDLGLADRPSSWDGLADTLWGELASLQQDHAVLVWHHADVLLQRSVATFLQATTILVDLARAVQTTETGFPRPLHFHVLFIGDDPAFASAD